MRFEIYRRLTLVGKRWFWRLKAENHEIIASGEGYRNLADAENAVRLVKSTGPDTETRLMA